MVKEKEVDLLVDIILKNLSESKADKILNIDLNGRSELVDNMIIASGTSNRHVASIAEKLMTKVKRDQGIPVRAEGMNNADWVLLDCGDVVVHVFRQEVRDFYQLERLWEYNPTNTSDHEKF